MNLTMEMTSRDKKLLLMLAGVLIVVGIGWVVIRPMLTEINDLEGQIAQAETNRLEAEHQLNRTEALQSDLAETAKQMEQDAAALYPVMQTQAIDNLLTTLALEAGFDGTELRELTIQAPTECEQAAAYLADSTTQTESTEETVLTGIYTADVTFSLRADRGRLESFVDQIADGDEAIQVTSCLWSEDNAELGTYSLTLGLRIWMTDGEAAAEAASALAAAD